MAVGLFSMDGPSKFRVLIGSGCDDGRGSSYTDGLEELVGCEQAEVPGWMPVDREGVQAAASGLTVNPPKLSALGCLEIVALP